MHRPGRSPSSTVVLAPSAVSASAAGDEVDGGPSGDPVLSADGRYVACSTTRVGLGPRDTHSLADVYVYDRVTGAFDWVSPRSRALAGERRHVAFASAAATLVLADHNGVRDVFVRTR